MSKVCFRMATIDDVKDILAIYEPYILNTPITFEFNPVPEDEFIERINRISKQFPYILCVIDDEVAGYAYCSYYLEKEGFSWDCEITVYVAESFHKRGIATALYKILIPIIKQQGYYNIYSLICVPNESSVYLHEKFGFREVGIYYNTAYKLAQWRDLLVMEKKLREYELSPKKPMSVHELDKGFVDDLLNDGCDYIK